MTGPRNVTYTDLSAPGAQRAAFDAVPAGQDFHLVGIGGAGMSVVAELLAARGYTVSGSDQRESANLERLRALGVRADVGHDAENVPPGAILVVSTAVRPANPEYARAAERGQAVWHRSTALAFAALGRDFVAVAGAHGKTSTSGMIAVALRAAGEDPSWAVGGTLRVPGADGGMASGAHLGAGGALVAEADESDGSFLHYRPRIGLVTNVEPDHLDHYGSPEAFEAAFVAFTDRIVPGGLLVTCADDAGARRLARTVAARRTAGDAGEPGAEAPVRVWTYGTQSLAELGAEGELGQDAHVVVAVVEAGALGSRLRLTVEAGADAATPPPRKPRILLDLQVPGTHMALNAAAAWITCLDLGVAPEVAARCLGEFRGTGRRFELRGEAGGVRVVDDYAHHPTEVAATLRTARVTAGEGRVLVVFQPHLYSRTRQFAREFAEALELADLALVTDVYRAREDPDGVTSGRTITELAHPGTGDVRSVPDRVEAAHAIAAAARADDLVMTIGAGDVTELGDVVLADLEERA